MAPKVRVFGKWVNPDDYLVPHLRSYVWATMDEILAGEPHERTHDIRQLIQDQCARGFLIREWHDAKVAFVFKHRNKDLLWALA